MKRILALALGLLTCAVGCAPRPQEPPGVRSLRQQRRRITIALPVWDADVAQEVAADPATYAGKTLSIQRAYLDPKAELAVGKEVTTFPLRGGGAVVIPTAAVPGWMRKWTGAPLKVSAVLHPPRRPGEAEAATGPVLRGLFVDFACPLELAAIDIERAQDGTYATALVENYRTQKTGANVAVRFGAVRASTRIRPLAAGERAQVRVKLFGADPPRWASLPIEARSLRLVCDDGSALAVDLAKWLDPPADLLIDLGYSFTPPGNAVMALSSDHPEAELERFAALELRSYLAQCTDANIEPREPDGKEPLPAKPVLVVGTAAHNPLAAQLIRQAGIEARVAAVGPDGYVLKTLTLDGRPALLVTAATARGLVYGCYGLLERYGVRFSLSGARLPAQAPFRIVEVDETRVAALARRSIVASDEGPDGCSRWSQWQWISMIDLAAKNRLNEVVMPLDALEAAFTSPAEGSRGAAFPFEVGPYLCVAEAHLAHQRGLALLAELAQRRGIDLAFARRATDGKLAYAAPPACLATAVRREAGQAIRLLEDPGDLLGLPRLEESAKLGADLLRANATALWLPYGRGRTRASFLARFAWDKELTPAAYYRDWAASLCEGKAAERLAEAILAGDQLDGELLATVPTPFGLGTGLILPVEQKDLDCEWAGLRARATSPPVLAQINGLKAQGQKLRDLQRKLDPIQAAFNEALGTVAPPWEDPLFAAAPASQRAERISQGFYTFRSLLGALASVQEGTLAYYAGLAEPEEALSRLAVAASKYRKARRILLWIARSKTRPSLEPTLNSLAGQLELQADRLAEWLGPASDAEPIVRLHIQGSDAIVHLFRTAQDDVYAAYKLTGQEVVHLRLNTSEVRLSHRGQPPKPLRAEGGAFLVSLDAVPTYIVARRAAWPGQPSP